MMTEAEKVHDAVKRLKQVFQKHQSLPFPTAHLINPLLRGWVNYFALGTLAIASTTFKTG
jgi:hypothetical protein